MEFGYSMTSFGKAKDRNDGLFKQYDSVRM